MRRFYLSLVTILASAMSYAPWALSGEHSTEQEAARPALIAAVGAADRSPADKALDAGRQPVAMLNFFNIAPGMRVGEIEAGGGYTTELLARVVGPSGKVYAQNSPEILAKFAQKPWTERLAKPVMKPVVRLDREAEAPFPADVKDLDAVVDVLFYHDLVWLKVDRKKMNQAIFAALKHGGYYGIVDHAAKDGHGLQDVQTLHRIEEKTLRQEVEEAGFKHAGDATFLSNPSDSKDWSTSPSVAGAKRGTSDRFVILFRKP